VARVVRPARIGSAEVLGWRSAPRAWFERHFLDSERSGSVLTTPRAAGAALDAAPQAGGSAPHDAAMTTRVAKMDRFDHPEG
jgi:hypothetical protein